MPCSVPLTWRKTVQSSEKNRTSQMDPNRSKNKINSEPVCDGAPSVVCHLEKLMTEFIKHKKVIKGKPCTERFRLTTYHAQFSSSSTVRRSPSIICLDKDVFPESRCWCCWCRRKYDFFLLSSHRFSRSFHFLPPSFLSSVRNTRRKIKLSSTHGFCHT